MAAVGVVVEAAGRSGPRWRWWGRGGARALIGCGRAPRTCSRCRRATPRAWALSAPPSTTPRPWVTDSIFNDLCCPVCFHCLYIVARHSKCSECERLQLFSRNKNLTCFNVHTTINIFITNAILKTVTYFYHHIFLIIKICNISIKKHIPDVY